jgi:hypothetical protein
VGNGLPTGVGNTFHLHFAPAYCCRSAIKPFSVFAKLFDFDGSEIFNAVSNTTPERLEQSRSFENWNVMVTESEDGGGFLPV